MKIKICGIPTLEVAEKICTLRPDAIGIYVDPQIGSNFTDNEFAKEIVEFASKSAIETFLLTDILEADGIVNLCSTIGNSHVQIRTEIPVVEIEKLKKEMPDLQIVKVIGVVGEESQELAKMYDNSQGVDQLLLDSKVGTQRGGTGVVHDWNISRQIVLDRKKPVWLAGGIKLHTVKYAIETVRPYGIDVETGVQNPDGTKNYQTIKEFISLVHQCNRS